MLIESTIQKGMNMIHDGPSIMETASWLDSRFKEWASHRGKLNVTHYTHRIV